MSSHDEQFEEGVFSGFQQAKTRIRKWVKNNQIFGGFIFSKVSTSGLLFFIDSLEVEEEYT